MWVEGRDGKDVEGFVLGKRNERRSKHVEYCRRKMVITTTWFWSTIQTEGVTSGKYRDTGRYHTGFTLSRQNKVKVTV